MTEVRTERARLVRQLHEEWCGHCLLRSGYPCRIPVLIDAAIVAGAEWMRELAINVCHAGNDPRCEVTDAIRAIDLEAP